MDSNTADDHFVDAEVIDPVVVSDPKLSSAGPPEYATSADFKKEKEAHLVGKEWKDRKKDSKKEKAGQRKDKEEEEAANRGSGDGHGGGMGMQSTVIISVVVVAVVGVVVAVARKFSVR